MSNTDRLSVRYPRTRASVGKARDSAREFADSRGLNGVSDDVVQIVSELIANAIVHGKTSSGRRVGLTIHQYADRVRIEVRDTGDGIPRKRRDERPLAVSGRGLGIVEILSTSWGVTEQVIGKTVWAEIQTKEAV
ncbi:ATP-binding protein [Streptomyces sp. LBUM 1485]|uniref:ATP-binding protein n=1 Tax=Streptomyces sp. NPDC058954 TaxID=3346677 RepID=UPI001FF37E5D